MTCDLKGDHMITEGIFHWREMWLQGYESPCSRPEIQQYTLNLLLFCFMQLQVKIIIGQAGASHTYSRFSSHYILFDWHVAALWETACKVPRSTSPCYRSWTCYVLILQTSLHWKTIHGVTIQCCRSLLNCLLVASSQCSTILLLAVVIQTYLQSRLETVSKIFLALLTLVCP